MEAGVSNGGNSTVENRPIYVFLSSPGDVTAEKDLLDDAIRDVASVFRQYGIAVLAWRHERDVVPDVGCDPQAVVNAVMPGDYDIYVGLMCGRFGTPTGRAGSGTVEEFQDAYSRFSRTGKPRILFYFCANPPGPSSEEQKSQLEKVSAFRRQYPGIFCSFQSKSDLIVQFQRHLVERVLGFRFPRRDAEKPPVPRPWVLRLAAEIDCLERSNGKAQYLDYSSERPARVLKRLEKLIDLDNILVQAEREILTAAAYVRLLRRRGERIGQLSRHLEEILSLSLEDVGEVEVVLEGRKSLSGKIRSDLLAALLQLGDLLDLDRAAISNSGRVLPPPDKKLKNWLAFLTQEVSIPQRGVVRFRLLAPVGEWADSLRRVSALRIERFWVERRTLFTRNGVVFVAAPGEVLITDEIHPPPGDLLGRIAETGAWLQTHLGRVRHWGQHQLSAFAPDLSTLLPLPESAVSGQVEFDSGSEFFRRLTLRSPMEKEIVIEADQGTALMLEPRLMKPGVRYGWILERDYGTGSLSPVGWGTVWALSEREHLLWEVKVAMSPPEERRHVQAELQLWNDLLQDVWIRLTRPEASYEDWLLARRILYSAYDCVRQIAPGSAQVDLYRRATEWADSNIQTQVGEEGAS